MFGTPEGVLQSSVVDAAEVYQTVRMDDGTISIGMAPICFTEK